MDEPSSDQRSAAALPLLEAATFNPNRQRQLRTSVVQAGAISGSVVLGDGDFAQLPDLAKFIQSPRCRAAAEPGRSISALATAVKEPIEGLVRHVPCEQQQVWTAWVRR